MKGLVQRRKVYVLTDNGRRSALGIRDRIRFAIIHVRDSSGDRETTIAEVLAGAKGSRSILDVVRESLQAGVLDLNR